jgi:hypothetical protein
MAVVGEAARAGGDGARATSAGARGASAERVCAIADVTTMMARQRVQRTRKPEAPAAATRSSGIWYFARQLKQL